jgi:hypothetical protein
VTRNRRLLLILAMLSSLAAALATGCNKEEPKSEVGRFIDQYRDLPEEAFVDTLQALATGGGPFAHYAHFELGNMYYEQASALAMEKGWNDSALTAPLDSSMAHFEWAIAIDSTFVEAYVNLGSLWDDLASATPGGGEDRQLKLDRTEKARSLYEQAIAIDPGDEKARCNLGALHMRLRQTTEAVDQFRAALAANPGSALAHYNLAIAFAEEKMYREAIVEWQAAVKADPKGDIGARSRENIKIVEELMNTEIPENLAQPAADEGH